MSDLRERLKTTTAGLHRKLESDLNLTRSDLTHRDYLELLKRLAGYYEVVENRLRRIAQGTRFEKLLCNRFKMPYLVADLEYCSERQHASATYPLANNVPAVRSLPAALGAMYVLEGATLGGQFLTRHLKQTLRLDELHGAVFFASYGSQVHVMWQAFCKVLAEPMEAEQESEVIETAKETFISLHQWLCFAKDNNHVSVGVLARY